MNSMASSKAIIFLPMFLLILAHACDCQSIQSECPCPAPSHPPPKPQIPHPPPSPPSHLHPPPVITTPPPSHPPPPPRTAPPVITTPPPPPPHTIPPVITPPTCPPQGCPKPPVTTGTCPIDALKLGLCLDVLGGLVHVVIGNPIENICCPVIKGLVEVEAAICLCTAIRAKLLDLNIFVPLAVQVLVTCGYHPPPGFTCPPIV